MESLEVSEDGRRFNRTEVLWGIFFMDFFSVIGGVACASINRSVMFRDQCDYREHCLKDAVWTAKRTPATQTTQGYGR